MTNEMFLLGDVARQLDVRPHQVVYLLQSRQVPEPALRLGCRRIFSAEDVRRIAAKLHVGHNSADQERMYKERKRHGAKARIVPGILGPEGG